MKPAAIPALSLSRLLMPLALGLLLSACGQDAPESAPAAPATPAASAPIADEPALDPAAAASMAAAQPAAEIDAPAPAQVTATDASPVPGLVLGQDYEIIEGGQRMTQQAGVEVAEVFAYWCGGCAHFDPLIDGWKRRLPAGVNFVYVPAVFNPQDSYPRAYYAAEAAGILERVHPAIFRAIHVERRLRPNASADEIANFLAAYGVSVQEIKSTMDSFAVTTNLNRARTFAERNRVPHTPNLIINGTWRVNGRNQEDQLRIADQLIAHALRASR